MTEGGRYKMKLRVICLDSSSAFIRVMRAAISLSEVMVCRLLTLDLRLRRRMNEGRDAVYFEDFADNDTDKEEEEEDVELEAEDLPLALLAHLVIACSTTEARAPSRPPVKKEPEDEEEELEDRIVAGVEGRGEGG